MSAGEQRVKRQQKRYAFALVIEQLDGSDPWELLASVLLDRKVEGHQVCFIGGAFKIDAVGEYDSDQVARAIFDGELAE